MKSFAIVLIALHIERNALFGDEDLFSDPKALFDVPRRPCSSNCYHPDPIVALVAPRLPILCGASGTGDRRRFSQSLFCNARDGLAVRDSDFG